MIKVKSHIRGSHAVRSHRRKQKKSAAWKKQHPGYTKWGDRVDDSTPMATLLKKKEIFSKELAGIQNGTRILLPGHGGHLSFIIRRLRNVNSVLAKRIKQQ